MKKPTIYYSLFLLSLFLSCSEKKTQKQNVVTSDPDSLAGKKTYLNPADGKVYTTEGKFEKYMPEGGVKPIKGPVQKINIILLTDQNKIPGTINIEDLANFIKGVDTVVSKSFLGTIESGKIIVQFTLYANKIPQVELSYQGNIKNKSLNDLHQNIQSFCIATRTKKDSCVFQSIYALNSKQN